MKYQITEAANGYLVTKIKSFYDVDHSLRKFKTNHVFANLESALSFIKKEFGESDET